MAEPAIPACPGCGAALEPTATACPKCLLPRHLMSGEQGISPGSVPDVPAKRRGGPWTPILFLALGGAAIAVGARLMRRPDAPPPAPAPAESAPLSPEQPPAAAAPSVDPGTPQTAGQVTDSLPRPVAPAAIPDRQAVKGEVYDLLTLSGVRGAVVEFRDKSSGKTVRATTNAQGAYAAHLPLEASEGYVVAVRYKGRELAFLEDMDPSYKTQDKDRRAYAAEMLTSPSLVHVPIMTGDGRTELRYDVALLAR